MEKDFEKTETLDAYFDRIRIKNTNHMDKKGNYTRPPQK